MFPLSIPSPPSDWRYFDLGAWLASFLPFVPEDFSLRIHAYAILILIGIFAAVVLTNHRSFDWDAIAAHGVPILDTRNQLASADHVERL